MSDLKKEFDETGGTVEPQNPQHTGEKEAAATQRSPRSVMMMEYILLQIAIRHYGVQGEHIEVIPGAFEDSDVAFYYELKPAIDEKGLEDIYEDPDTYSKLRQMCSDLMGEDPKDSLHIVPEELYIETRDKMTLYKVLKNYLDNPEYNIRTEENGFGGHNSDLSEEELKESMDGEIRELLMLNMNSHSYTRESYEAALLRGMRNDIGISMDHLYKVICQEDGIAPERGLARAPVVGGYN